MAADVQPTSDPRSALAPRPHARRPYIPLLVLAAALLSTGVITRLVDRASKAAEQTHYQAVLDSSAREVRDRIARRREAYVAILHGTAGLFAGDRYVPPDVFTNYVNGLKLQQTYPGVQGVGVIIRATTAKDLDEVRNLLARLGQAPRVWPEDPPRDVYYPIIHLEPLDETNRKALGYDPFTDPIRRAALERARDEGTVGVTAKIRLVQDSGPGARAAFGMFYPIYRTGNLPPPASTEERRQRLVAFVCSPFRADDFLRGVFADGYPSSLSFEVYDGTDLSPEHLLSASASSTSTRPAASWHAGAPLKLDMGGRTWTLAFRTQQPPPAAAGLSRAALAVLGAGGAVSLVLFALSLLQWRARRAAEQTSADLHAAAEELRRREQERVRLLAAEKDARADAEAANRSKDEFLATLSHELRTPLNAILGWAQLLRTGALPTDESAEGLETIERNAKAQAQLVDDLLDLSRIISGKLRVESGPVDLVAVVEGALDSVRPAAEAKGIQVVPVLDAHAGPVVGDAGRLQQVAWNLLSNAIKFTQRGGRVDVWLVAAAGDAELTVSDNGAGIAAEFLPHVFDRPRQAAASSTRHHGGLGLGLAIARHLVELHGGTVSAVSEGPGRGATFTVRLPKAAAPRAEAAPDSDVHKPPAARLAEQPSGRERSRTPASLLGGVNVLVVDDEPDAREVMRLGLEQRGARVTVAASASEALTALRSAGGAFHVVLSDIGMPDEDGYSLIRRVRQLDPTHGRDVPAVALTAYARAEDKTRAIEAGFQKHVSKPVEPVALASVVADLVGKTTPGGEDDTVSTRV